MRLITLAVLAFAAAYPLPVTAQPEPMTLERIMADPDWLGTPPQNAFWAEDGTAVYYTRRRAGVRGVDDLWVHPRDGSGPRIVELSARAQHGAADGDYNADRTLKAFVRLGDLYLQDLRDGEIQQLTRTAAGYRDPRFLNDGRIAVRAANSFYAYEPADGRIERIAEIRFEKDPHDTEPGSGYLDTQQRRLLTVVSERQARAEAERAREADEIAADAGRPARAWYLGEKRELVDAELSPDGRWLLVATQASERDGARRDTVPFFVTDDAFVDNRPVRPKVGAGAPVPHSYLLLDLTEGERRELDLSTLPGIDTDPLRRLRAQAELPVLEGPRGTAWMGAEWNADGSTVALMMRANDNKDRWLATVDPADGRLRPRHRLSDEAWINWYTGRDFFWFNDFGWLPDGSTLWYVSEESGYAHLYVRGARDRRARALTRGDFEVSKPVLTRDGRHFYYTANAEHPGIHEVYRVAVADGRSERLTQLGARTHFQLSPDERALLLTSSSTLRHDELFVQAVQPGSEAVQLTDTMSAEYREYPWAEPQVVAIPSTNVRGRAVYSRVYLPSDYNAERAEPYPVVMFAHGAGYLQNAHFGWSGYFREFMFHTYLVERGFVVIDMDFRASAGYGRDWRTAIYRDMGRPELADFKDGIDWLDANHNIDRARIGIYGGSYGGFLAFMGLFLEPDMFAAGAALRPVSDWAHYHHPYTANILNTPELDPEAFERSSPIEFAEGLNKPLLILSPMVDTNVLFKDVVRLTQRLIELEKTEYFTNALYPVEDHGFVEPSSWLDEYKRIYMLFDQHLR
ncbi:MAG: prolyl oligopeptidase family serine peptidase [Xanthomonadaceae bacterium]|nr:prolyl oligopeptidase family serine peptidase [Xanthomonadaceae bacterium]